MYEADGGVAIFQTRSTLIGTCENPGERGERGERGEERERGGGRGGREGEGETDMEIGEREGKMG